MKIKFILITFVLYLFSCVKSPDKNFQQTFFAFDTVITITIADNSLNNKEFNKIIDDLKNEAEKYDRLFNNYNKKSEISRLRNFKINKFYPINNEVYYVLEKSKEYYYLSGKAFDITIGKITELYDFHNNKIPSEDDIKKNLKFVSMENVILSNGRIKFLKKNIYIDPGGIAKGYIIDKFSEFIKKKGYADFLVNIGGDIYASGKNKNRQKWVIGIQDPKRTDEIIKKIAISDKAVVTSGDYERYIQREKKYHHIINPATGQPVWNNIISVTIIADTTVDADTIATSLFVLGVEKSKEFIEKNFKNKVNYYIITEDKGKLSIINNLYSGFSD